MLDKSKLNLSKYILAIHSTNNHFGFAYKLINDNNSQGKFFIKKFNRDLSNNLVFDLAEFLSDISFDAIERISVSNGPANFNATRLIVVLARTIAQQIKCPIDYFSCFRIMAKRIAIKNNIVQANKYFWIVNKLKHRGYIAGQYMINLNTDTNQISSIKEVTTPSLYKNMFSKDIYYEVDYDSKEDLKELLQLSFENFKKSVINSWEDVLPIYPISAIN